MQIKRFTASLSLLALTLNGCGGGGASTSSAVTPPPPPPTTSFSVPAAEALSVTDVQTIIAQAAAEARARNLPSTIAVVDRVGNVLGVFAMTGANLSLRIPDAPGGRAANTELQGLTLSGAAVAGAIAKAITGAYLSSGGNAFSTRTASQIVQEHFPPAPTTRGLESGPLYGVQFSQLPCSDFSARFGTTGTSAMIGPKRSPLGLAADAGGLPLYKNGVLVGGIGIMGDGVYGFDPNILDIDQDDEEFIAVGGAQGFAAPQEIRAERISVDGTTLRFSDATTEGLRSSGTAPAFATINGSQGALVAVPGYATASIIAGTAYGSEASGIRASTAAEFSNRDAFVLTNGAGVNRFPIRAGTDGAANTAPLSTAEVRAVLEEAFTIMTRARAQIRRPLDSRAQVSISVVDTFGAPLGIVRSPDAPIFGTDVSLQKARTAAFFTNANAASELLINPNPDVVAMMNNARTFFADPAAFTGKTAWPNRAIGLISRPYFPDGELGRNPGPFSRGINGFNPFSTGMQSALIVGNIVTHVNFLLSGGTSADTPARCTSSPDVAPGQNRLQNGIQMFPGSVPIFRGSQLVGAIGVSGDGIDQDDMIGFLGTHNAGVRVGGIGNAPSAIRSDQISVAVTGAQPVRLRYIGCPFAPFLDTADQNVCQGR
ncbi:MAG: heme-binding protein [Sphingomonadaceae bacterium]